MRSFDKIFVGLILGFTFPLFLSLLSLFIWFYADKNQDRALVFVSTGFFIGCIIDLKYLKGWITNRYELNLWFLSAIYIFYNIMIYGFFMGFPVFNALMGLVAGYYFGKRMNFMNLPDETRSKIIKQVSIFTGFVMILICISSGFIALAGEGVGKDVQNMLGLSFEVTKPMILGIAIGGGIFLVLFQMIITGITLKKMINN